MAYKARRQAILRPRNYTCKKLKPTSDIDKFSKACKEIGFNSYGYGCPESLRNDMPFIESWNHLVPISYYRGKKSVRFIDIFDPKEQKNSESGVKFICHPQSK